MALWDFAAVRLQGGRCGAVRFRFGVDADAGADECAHMGAVI